MWTKCLHNKMNEKESCFFQEIRHIFVKLLMGFCTDETYVSQKIAIFSCQGNCLGIELQNNSNRKYHIFLIA